MQHHSISLFPVGVVHTGNSITLRNISQTSVIGDNGIVAHTTKTNPPYSATGMLTTPWVMMRPRPRPRLRPRPRPTWCF